MMEALLFRAYSVKSYSGDCVDEDEVLSWMRGFCDGRMHSLGAGGLPPPSARQIVYEAWADTVV